MIRRSGTAFLREMGYSVEAAATFEAAQSRLVKEQPPWVVLYASLDNPEHVKFLRHLIDQGLHARLVGKTDCGGFSTRGFIFEPDAAPSADKTFPVQGVLAILDVEKPKSFRRPVLRDACPIDQILQGQMQPSRASGSPWSTSYRHLPQSEHPVWPTISLHPPSLTTERIVTRGLAGSQAVTAIDASSD